MSVYNPPVQNDVEESNDEPTITRHVEPESQALTTGEPATYFRCECGRESMRKRDLRSEAHAAECTARGGL